MIYLMGGGEGQKKDGRKEMISKSLFYFGSVLPYGVKGGDKS